MKRHPAVNELLRYFEHGHLVGAEQRNVAARFHALAHELVANDKIDGPELTVALRKLLEAKDCAVRASL